MSSDINPYSSPASASPFTPARFPLISTLFYVVATGMPLFVILLFNGIQHLGRPLLVTVILGAAAPSGGAFTAAFLWMINRAHFRHYFHLALRVFNLIFGCMWVCLAVLGFLVELVFLGVMPDWF